MRILFVTQWFDPEPTFKGLAFARELARMGHQVQVLTGFPNYPGGKIYPGYRVRLLQRQQIDGIDIVRVPLYPSHSRSTVGRIANYLSFAAAATLIGPLVLTRPDAIYAYHPPPTVGLPALVLRMMFGTRLVYDIQDMWPDTVAATGMLRATWMLRLLSTWCGFIYRHADHLTVLSPGFKRVLIQRGVPAERISVIYNWCDEAQIASGRGVSVTGALDQWSDKFLVVFAGTMGDAQALGSVLDAAQLVALRRPDVHFLFVGGGTDVGRLTRDAAARQLSNVSFLARVPVGEIGPVLARADALLVHLKDDPLFRITIPSKTQAYMAAGRPIVMAVGGDAEALLKQANCGIACDPENPRQLAAAVETLAGMSSDERQALGDNGRRFYDSACSLSKGAQSFEAVFRKVSEPEANVVTSPGMYRLHLKRVVDLVFAVAALIVLAPILLLLALIVRGTIGSPVLFRQLRPGKGGRPFTILKFRTMRVPDGRAADDADEARMTTAGRALRALSLDELPELLNVVKGDMSLVGPRPLLMQYLGRYTDEQMRRHDVRPGITGWAQVNGRNALTWEDKFRLDTWYVDSCSFALDMKILAMTIRTLATQDGISQPGQATATEFLGSPER
jgi:lipopolysaccharide/colanic/teichoic acid biosynthesis glycosyltransferase/glycosyltransferase involved in cell wall biosynthesis